MANPQTDNRQNQQQKKGFEQGTGNNSTSADPKKDRNQETNLEDQDQSRITNQDSKITNKDQQSRNDGSMRNDPKGQNERNEEEDVEETGDVEDNYNDDSEVNMPAREPEKTEKKIPNMGS